MSDLIYVAVTVGFFAVAFGLLRACERIIGPDTTSASAPSTSESEPVEPVEPVEATA
jgi:hypothetical protein